MATPTDPQLHPTLISPRAETHAESASTDLEQELRRAAEDFENGDYIELTPELLERCVAGKWPWPNASRG